ncbi:MAG TPA: hypothetical protein VJ958_04950, partial [Atribacterota bacterium]|nr:hypothetical protein [Atribacterota bacterium]
MCCSCRCASFYHSWLADRVLHLIPADFIPPAVISNANYFLASLNFFERINSIGLTTGKIKLL